MVILRNNISLPIYINIYKSLEEKSPNVEGKAGGIYGKALEGGKGMKECN